MRTWHKIVFGDCRNMEEIPNGTVHLMVTSPPYYNAPFDYPGLFKSYDEFLGLMKDFAKELYMKLAPGRIAAFVTDDMLVKGVKYPIVADITRIMMGAGFRYRDRIVWRKPEGYIRISRRSGVVLQHPYPMYFYPDNLQENIIIFQKGKFDYKYVRKLDPKIREASKIKIDEFQKDKWYLTVWDITNVLPLKGRLEKGIAAFPEEIPRRLIKLFTFVGETVLDPFSGSGTTTKVAKELGRNSYGYEIDLELKPVILKKIGYSPHPLTDDKIEIKEREDVRRLRTFLQKRVRKQKSVTKKHKAIEVKTYQRNDEGIRELSSVAGEEVVMPLDIRAKEQPKYRKNWKARLEWVNAGTRALVSQLIERVESELPEVFHVPKHRWCYFYKGRSQRLESLFAVLTITKQKLHIRIGVDPSKFIDMNNITKPYKRWFFKTREQERDFSINRPEQLDYALELLQQAYSLTR
jgi:DNA modification methylase